MKRKLASAASVVALLITAACGGGSETTKADPNAEIDPGVAVVYQNSWAASGMDPHKTMLGADGLFLGMFYDRLVHRSPAGDPIPGLAESWEFDKDGKALTLHLREGVTFSDGSVFDADAVVANLKRALEPDSGTAPLLAVVGDVRSENATTVVISLKGPGAALPLTLSDLPGMMVSPQAFATPAAATKLKTTPAGAGRYTLADAEAGARYVLKANPGYWDPAAIGATTFEWQVVADPQTRLNAISSNDANIIQVSTTLVAPAEARPELVVSAQPTLNSHTLNFNRSKSEFDKVEVRQAVLYAVDRQEIVEGALDGQATVADQPFPTGYFAHNEALEGSYAHDPDKARELLASVGLKDGFSFEVLVLNVAQIVREAEIIQAQLAKVGIKMKITPVALADLSAAFNRGEGDAAMNAWAGRGDPAILLNQYFNPAAPGNPSKSSAEGFEQAMSAANSAFDDTERGPLLGKVSQLVMDDALYLPIAFFNQGAIHSNNLVGYTPYVAGDEFRGVGVAK
ncbi:ABC transporter substrate-binding protein [Nocardioides sp. Bht2]|uniref:ABC transporter substrate-binding protein n=1 Tax=Nocardioides sp. Bht2 TaxID=3392297 RepID=UPI0039B6C412